MEGGEAVEEPALASGLFHQFLCHPIGGQVFDPLLPHAVRLAHGDPHVGVDHIRAGDGFVWVADKFQHRACFGGNGLTLFDQRRIGKILLRGTGHEVHPHLGAAHHQGIPHVVPGVAHVYELFPLQTAEMLLNGEEIRKYLGGVEFVGQPVPDRHAGKLGKLLYDGLGVAPVFNAVVHPPQHTGGVGDGFFFAHLGAGGAKIGHAHAQVMPRHLKGAAGTGGILFKQQRDVLPLVDAVGNARFFLRFQLRRQT